MIERRKIHLDKGELLDLTTSLGLSLPTTVNCFFRRIGRAMMDDNFSEPAALLMARLLRESARFFMTSVSGICIPNFGEIWDYGTGLDVLAFSARACPDCRGCGFVIREFNPIWDKCPDCEGTGFVTKIKCRCGGEDPKCSCQTSDPKGDFVLAKPVRCKTCYPSLPYDMVMDWLIEQKLTRKGYILNQSSSSMIEVCSACEGVGEIYERKA